MRLVQAILIDLDDTLYPQQQFLDQAWDVVASTAAENGIDYERLRSALRTVCAQGSAKGDIIDRALMIVGARPALTETLVDAFQRFTPASLDPYPEVASALSRLGRDYALAIVTDGNPAQQRAKLQSTGLRRYFDVVICSDDDGRAARKPSPIPFQRACDTLGVSIAKTIMIGDSPHKDIAGACNLGMASIRVTTGEYAARPDLPGAMPTLRCDAFRDTPAAVAALEWEMATRRGSVGAPA